MPLIPGIMGKKTIVLEAEEAVLTVKCGCCNTTTRRPYGELGSVDSGTCLCFVCLASDLSKGGPICPGCGCNAPYVQEIVEEMKKRMKERGDTGVVKRSDEQLVLLRTMDNKMDAIVQHFNIVVPSQMTMTAGVSC